MEGKEFKKGDAVFYEYKGSLVPAVVRRVRKKYGDTYYDLSCKSGWWNVDNCCGSELYNVGGGFIKTLDDVQKEMRSLPEKIRKNLQPLDIGTEVVVGNYHEKFATGRSPLKPGIILDVNEEGYKVLFYDSYKKYVGPRVDIETFFEDSVKSREYLGADLVCNIDTSVEKAFEYLHVVKEMFY